MPVSRAAFPLAFAALALALTACGSTAPTSVVLDGGSKDALVITFPTMVDAGHDVRTTHPVDAGQDTSTGTNQDTGVDAGMPPDNTFPAFLPDVPQVVQGPGSVLANPVFVPVLFAGDQYTTELPEYLAAVGASQYWHDATAEYGVGAATTSPAIILNETMPSLIDDDQLQVWLQNEIGTDPRFGALGSSLFDAGAFDAGSGFDASAPFLATASQSPAIPQGAIYVLFLPTGTNVTLQGATSCQSFGGYHNSTNYPTNSETIVYAAVPRCGSLGNLTGFDELTGATSHELAEAATDPAVGGNGDHTAFGSLDMNHIYWEFILGGAEVGDMCAQFPQAFFNPSEPALASYTVQRIWSNKAASAGEDPCRPLLPTTAEPFYFNAVPKGTTVGADFMGFNFPTLAVTAHVNVPTVIEVDTFSTAAIPAPGWTVQAVDANSLMGGSTSLTFSPAQQSGNNGNKLQFTMTSNGGGGTTTHPFFLFSTDGILQNWWVGVEVDD
jgi:hypothetical protein